MLQTVTVPFSVANKLTNTWTVHGNTIMSSGSASYDFVCWA